MIAKAQDFFSNIYGNTQNIRSNRRKKTEYQIHSFISKIQKKKKRVCPVLFLFYLWLAQNFPDLNILSF